MVEQSDSTNSQTDDSDSSVADAHPDWEACTTKLSRVTELATWIVSYAEYARLVTRHVRDVYQIRLVNLHRMTSDAAEVAADMTEQMTALQKNLAGWKQPLRQNMQHIRGHEANCRLQPKQTKCWSSPGCMLTR